MSSVNPYLVILGIIVFFYLFRYMRAISRSDFFISREEQASRDREIIEELGKEELEYSDPYYAKLTKPVSVGENLPTRSCDSCGAAVNPSDQFCAKCGTEIN
ncbi:MAG: zinc ribbon domain-containing protein [Candidatus Kariarchaeaceae archaeon]|jgi:hypothetical protein